MPLRIPLEIPDDATPVVAVLDREGPDVELFAWSLHGEARGGILVRVGAEPKAWVDSCPHWNTPLSQYGNRVWNGRELRCTMHGATFAPHDGACTGGPCEGTSLTAMAARIDGDELHIHAPVVLSLGTP